VNQDPARFAAQVTARAREAGVDPRLVMAILYNESYKPHDPALERAWQNVKPDAAFGVANMHRPTFDETKRGRAFAARDWQELPDDPDLAIQAEAWYLHDLAAQLPTKRSGPYSTGELLALGYNTGPGNMKAYARGTKPGPQAQSYLDSLRSNWARAGDAVGHT
jgi:soluble lytic murein transglycosylase-like protein